MPAKGLAFRVAVGLRLQGFCLFGLSGDGWPFVRGLQVLSRRVEGLKFQVRTFGFGLQMLQQVQDVLLGLGFRIWG